MSEKPRITQIVRQVALAALIAQITSVLGSVVASVGLILWPGSTVSILSVDSVVDLFVPTLLVSTLVVQGLTLVFVAPFYAGWHHHLCRDSIFPWRGGIWGGTGYPMLWLFRESLGGGGALLSYVATHVYVFHCIVGVVYGLAFEIAFRAVETYATRRNREVE